MDQKSLHLRFIIQSMLQVSKELPMTLSHKVCLEYPRTQYSLVPDTKYASSVLPSTSQLGTIGLQSVTLFLANRKVLWTTTIVIPNSSDDFSSLVRFAFDAQTSFRISDCITWKIKIILKSCPNFVRICYLIHCFSLTFASTKKYN